MKVKDMKHDDMIWNHIYAQIDAILEKDEHSRTLNENDGVKPRRKARIIKLKWPSDEQEDENEETQDSQETYEQPIPQASGKHRRHRHRDRSSP